MKKTAILKIKLDLCDRNRNFGEIIERSEEHTSELQSHSFISYAVFCLKKKKNNEQIKQKS